MTGETAGKRTFQRETPGKQDLGRAQSSPEDCKGLGIARASGFRGREGQLMRPERGGSRKASYLMSKNSTFLLYEKGIIRV